MSTTLCEWILEWSPLRNLDFCDGIFQRFNVGWLVIDADGIVLLLGEVQCVYSTLQSNSSLSLAHSTTFSTKTEGILRCRRFLEIIQDLTEIWGHSKYSEILFGTFLVLEICSQSVFYSRIIFLEGLWDIFGKTMTQDNKKFLNSWNFWPKNVLKVNFVSL